MNSRFFLVLTGLSAFLVVPLTARPVPRESLSFRELGLSLEVDLPAVPPVSWSNASLLELPAELALHADAGVRLRDLRVLDADDRQVLRIDTSMGRASGIAEVNLEVQGDSLGQLLQEFPRGCYRVEATTVHGAVVYGEVVLRVRLPGPFHVVSPAPDDVVPLDAAEITWTPARGASGYVLEVEAESGEAGFEIRLPPTTNRFLVPERLLSADSAYEYSLVVQGDTDNELEVEGRFRTARAAH